MGNDKAVAVSHGGDLQIYWFRRHTVHSSGFIWFCITDRGGKQQWETRQLSFCFVDCSFPAHSRYLTTIEYRMCILVFVFKNNGSHISKTIRLSDSWTLNPFSFQTYHPARMSILDDSAKPHYLDLSTTAHDVGKWWGVELDVIPRVTAGIFFSQHIHYDTTNQEEHLSGLIQEIVHTLWTAFCWSFHWFLSWYQDPLVQSSTDLCNRNNNHL